MRQLKNVVITGSNRGIGFALASKLAEKGGFNIIMAVRDLTSGLSATSHLQTKFPKAQVTAEYLDMTSTQSITDFIQRVEGRYKHVDFLINNAGIMLEEKPFGPKFIDPTFQTNFYGTVELTEKMLPILQQSRIITIGAIAGKMSYRKITNDKLKERFQNPALTKEQLFQLMEQYQTAVADGSFQAKGWPKWIYGVSKLGINLFGGVFSRRKDVQEKGVQVYVCCPGWVSTQLTGFPAKASSVEEGIKTPMYLIQLPNKIDPQLQGQFFEKSRLSSTFQ